MSRSVLDDLEKLSEDDARAGTVRVRARGAEKYKYQKQRDGSWKSMGKAKPDQSDPRAVVVGLSRARKEPEPWVGNALPEPPQPPRATPSIPKIEIPQGRKWMDTVPGMASSTMEKNFDGEEPKHPRKALHEHIVRKFSDHVKPPGPEYKPIALFVIGVPASGKSSIIKGVAQMDFVQVDPEAVKEMIPEYEEAIETAGRNAADMVRDEAIFVTKKVRNKAVEDLKNLIINGTGDDSKPYKLAFRDLEELGYHVVLLMPYLDKATAKERARLRGEATGRWVPEEAFKDVEQIQRNYLMLADLANDAGLFDVSGKVPKLVHSVADGRSVDHDKEFMKALRGKTESVFDDLRSFFEGEDPEADDEEEPEEDIDPDADPAFTAKEIFKRAKEGLKVGRSKEEAEAETPKYKRSEGVILAHYGDEHLYA